MHPLSVREILADVRKSRNHVLMTTGIRCCYQRDDENFTLLSRLFNSPATTHEYWRDDERKPTVRAIALPEGTLVFVAGTDSSRLMERIRGGQDLVECPPLAGRIGQYYKQILDDIRGPVFELLSGDRGKLPIIIAGHSYGGVMAVLMGEWLRQSLPEPRITVFSYGSPRPGDLVNHEGMQVTHLRVVMMGDCITEFPRRTPGVSLYPLLGNSDVHAFSNHGIKYVISPGGQWIEREGFPQEDSSARGVWSDRAYFDQNFNGNVFPWYYTRDFHPVRVYQQACILASPHPDPRARIIAGRAFTNWNNPFWPRVTAELTVERSVLDPFVVQMKDVIEKQERNDGNPERNALGFAVLRQHRQRAIVWQDVARP